MIAEILKKDVAFKAWSVIRFEDQRKILTDYLLRLKPKFMLEIGTCRGVTTAYMSQFVEQIVTIDVKDYPGRKEFWDEMGIKRSNVIFQKVNDESEKRKFIQELDFDFAFVDGGHRRPWPEQDFEMVKRCGRVLFHDYSDDWKYDGVKEIVDKLGNCEIKKPFAYWENKK